MIQRIRRPDGTRADVDHGPGPCGYRIKSYQGAIGAVPLTQAIPPKMVDLWKLDIRRSGK